MTNNTQPDLDRKIRQVQECEISMAEFKDYISALIEEEKRKVVMQNQIELAKYIKSHLEKGDLQQVLEERLAELQRKDNDAKQ